MSGTTARVDEVTARAGARLHLGFARLEGEPARYLAAGLLLAEPALTVTARPSGKFLVTGADTGRAARVAEAACKAMSAPPLAIHIMRPLPPHRGLGSGTRLALTMAKLLARAAGRRISAAALARLTGRAERSVMGTALFARGGYAGAEGDTVTRAPFPRAWRVALITPADHARTRAVHGQKESRLIAQASPLHGAAAERLARLVMREAPRALAQEDYRGFSRVVEMLQAAARRQFSRAQGGAAATPAGRNILAWLRAQGITATGQSSWGPTLFAILPSAEDAALLARRLRARKELGEALITRVDNRGFRLTKAPAPR
ncbi:MAG: hypothetical protein HY804_04065 [Nitrospinae bacterium]|nr:hypothetical protein [Nitrospinota bacterium]